MTFVLYIHEIQRKVKKAESCVIEIIMKCTHQWASVGKGAPLG